MNLTFLEKLGDLAILDSHSQEQWSAEGGQ